MEWNSGNRATFKKSTFYPNKIITRTREHSCAIALANLAIGMTRNWYTG